MLIEWPMYVTVSQKHETPMFMTLHKNLAKVICQEPGRVSCSEHVPLRIGGILLFVFVAYMNL